MLDFKEAIQRAKNFLSEVYPVREGTVRLEGAELSEDERHWQITFSYFPVLETTAGNSPDAALEQVSSLFRQYTMIKVRRDDGTFLGFRKVAA